MTDQQAPVQQAPVGITDLAGVQSIPVLVAALDSSARKATGSDSAAECKDFSASCLALAQAIAVLDPTRLSGGDTPSGRKSALPDPLPPTRDGDKDGKIGS